MLLRRTRTRTRGTNRFHPRPPPRRKFSFFSSRSREKSIPESSREEKEYGGEKMSNTCRSFSSLSLQWFLLGFDTLTLMHTNSSFFLSFRRKKKKKDDDFKRDDDVDEKRDFDEKEEETDEKI